jgi:hypothetical protein
MNAIILHNNFISFDVSVIVVIIESKITKNYTRTTILKSKFKAID